MFSQKTRKLSVAILMLIIAVLFSFCIINNYKVANVNANVIEVINIDYVHAGVDYQVYEGYYYEIFPALPTEGELWSYNGPTGKKVALTWEPYGEPYDGILKYKLSFIMPDGYKFCDNYDETSLMTDVKVINGYRPIIKSLNDCSVNAPLNNKYTLPETLKGTVDGVNELVDIAVKWDSVADTSKAETKVYTATAVNSLDYKTEDGAVISAKLTLNVSPIKQNYKLGETFKSMEMDEYTLLGWAKVDDASLGVFPSDTTVSVDGSYFAIFVKLEYLGISFRINEQGVRYGFALNVCGLNSKETDTDKLDLEYVNKLIAKTLQKVTFTATIYNTKFDYPYTIADLKYAYNEEYGGYVSNLVFEKITNAQLDESVKVDACFEIGGKKLVEEGKAEVIRTKAQEAYDLTKFGVEDKETLDKMVQMYGVKV